MPSDTLLRKELGRWGAILIGLLLSSPAFADGAIVQGYTPQGTAVVTMAVSKSSAKNAETAALANCSKQAKNCGLLTTFKDTCIATTLFDNRYVDIGTGTTEAAAQAEAEKECAARGTSCTPGYTACDPPREIAAQPVTAPTAAPPAPPPSLFWTFFALFAVAAIGLVAYKGTPKRKVPKFPHGPRTRRRRRPTARPSAGICDWISRPRKYKHEPSKHDSEEAKRHLLAAWELIEPFIEAPVRGSYQEVEMHMEPIMRAAEHVSLAHARDPRASVQTEGKQSITLNRATLAQSILFIEAKAEIHRAHIAKDRPTSNYHLKRAIQCTRNAMAYRETCLYCLQLAHEYAYLGNKDEAMYWGRRARQLDPENQDAVQFAVAVVNIDPIWQQPIAYDLRLFVFWGVLFLLAVAILTFAITPFNWPTRETIYAIGFLPALAYFLILGARNKLRERLAKFPKTYWHYRHVREEGLKRKKIDQLFEHRFARDFRRKW